MRKLLLLFITFATENSFTQVKKESNYIDILRNYVNNLQIQGYDWIIIISTVALIIFWGLLKKKNLYYTISFVYFIILLVMYLITFVVNYSAFIDVINIDHYVPEQIPEFYAVSTTTPLLFTLYSFIFIIILYRKK